MNLLWISEGSALDHRPERFKPRVVTRNRPPALQFLDIAASHAEILMQDATLMLIDAGFVADRRFSLGPPLDLRTAKTTHSEPRG